MGEGGEGQRANVSSDEAASGNDYDGKAVLSLQRNFHEFISFLNILVDSPVVLLLFRCKEKGRREITERVANEINRASVVNAQRIELVNVLETLIFGRQRTANPTTLTRTWLVAGGTNERRPMAYGSQRCSQPWRLS